MSTDCLTCPNTPPEWRRSGRFFLIAIGLHGAALAYPLQRALQRDAVPLPVIQVQLGSQPVAPTPLPVQPAPPPKPVSKPQPAPKKVITQTTKVAVPTVTAAPTPVISEAPPVAAPVATVTPVNSNAKPAANPGSPTLSPVRFDVAYLQNPAPVYPAMSRRLGEEGKVLLRVKVSADGNPLTVNLEKSSNFTRLDDSALQVVNRWRFVPAKRGEEAIEASVIVPIVFRLEG